MGPDAAVPLKRPHGMRVRGTGGGVSSAGQLTLCAEWRRAVELRGVRGGAHLPGLRRAALGRRAYQPARGAQTQPQRL
jgi:hypothetical protein